MKTQQLATWLRSPWPQDPRRRVAWMTLVSLGMFAALATPFFLGRVYTDDDLGEFHLPLRAFYAERLAAGEPFDWMPSLYCGFFVTGEGQLGGYHPIHWLLYRMLPLGAAFDWELLLSYPCLLAGTYFLFRRLIRRRDAAMFGAIVFTFSGFCLLHFVHPNAIAVVAHTPWLLWAIDLTARPRCPRDRTLGLAAIALLTGSQCLVGYPQYVWLSLLVEIGFTFWRLIGFLPRDAFATPGEEPARAGTGRIARGAQLALAIAGAKACGALIGAQQLAPTFAALRDSLRATPDVAFSNYGSLHPLNLVQFLAPYLFSARVVGQNTHELGLYCGATPLLLCVWLWRERSHWGREAPVARAGFALAVVALVLAMGEHAGLYELQRWIPGANHFRFPCRAIVMAHLAIALLAAAAWSRLTWKARLRSLNMPHLRATLSGTAAVACGAAAAGALAWPENTASWWLVAAGPALAIVSATLLLFVARGHRWAWCAVPVFTALDLGLYGFTAGAYRDAADLRSYIASAPAPPEREGRVVTGRDNQNRRHGDRLLLAGFERADGYAGLEPSRRLDYSAPNVQRVAGVAFRRLAADAGAAPAWQAVGGALPRARLLTRVAVADAAPTLAGLDVDRVAAVDRRIDLDPAPPGKAVLLADSPGRIVIETTTAGRQLLALNEAFDAGWEAAIDGRPAAIVAVNGDFMGVVAPRGKHCVEMRFSPPSVRLGRRGSVLGLGLLMIGLCAAAATGQTAGDGTRRLRNARARRDRSPSDRARDARAGDAQAGWPGELDRATPSPESPPYADENPFVRIPKL